MWRCDLAEAARTPAFVDAVVASGFSRVSERMGVSVLEQDGSGHRVIVVLRSGRVQVRLDALTPHETRIEAAQRLYERLAALPG